MKPTKCEKVFMLIFITVIFLFMSVAISRFLIKNIIYDILHVRGTGIEFVLGDVLQSEDSSTLLDWEKDYPFHETVTLEGEPVDSKDGLDSKLKMIITEYCTTYAFMRDDLVRMNSLWRNLMNFHMVYTTESFSEVFKMNNGYYTYAEPKKNIDIASQNVQKLSEYIHNIQEGVRFLYVQPPSKTNEFDRQMDVGILEYTNENTNQLLMNIDSYNISYLDYREQLRLADMDWYDAFYRTDHHWTTSTQLWAASELASYLNQNYDFHFDLDMLSEECYTFTNYEKSFMGAQGRKVAEKEKEDFELIIPNFATDLGVDIPADKINIRGEFADVMVNNENLNVSHIEEWAYESSRIFNEQLAHVHNYGNVNNEEKILFITDSFGAWVIPYLALDIRDIDVMHPAKFTGSIETYIAKEHPDLVIVMLAPVDIDNADMSKHTNIYDFR